MPRRAANTHTYTQGCRTQGTRDEIVRMNQLGRKISHIHVYVVCGYVVCVYNGLSDCIGTHKKRTSAKGISSSNSSSRRDGKNYERESREWAKKKWHKQPWKSREKAHKCKSSDNWFNRQRRPHFLALPSGYRSCFRTLSSYNFRPTLFLSIYLFRSVFLFPHESFIHLAVWMVSSTSPQTRRQSQLWCRFLGIFYTFSSSLNPNNVTRQEHGRALYSDSWTQMLCFALIFSSNCDCHHTYTRAPSAPSIIILRIGHGIGKSFPLSAIPNCCGNLWSPVFVFTMVGCQWNMVFGHMNGITPIKHTHNTHVCVWDRMSLSYLHAREDGTLITYVML